MFDPSDSVRAQDPDYLMVDNILIKKSDLDTYQLDILSTLNIEPLMEMDSYTASAQLALAGVAAALVPLSIVKALKIEEHYCFSFEQLTPLFRPVHLCVRLKSYENPRVKKLLETIVNAVPTEVSLPLS